MIAIKNIRCALLMMVLAAVTVSLPTGAQQRSRWRMLMLRIAEAILRTPRNFFVRWQIKA